MCGYYRSLTLYWRLVQVMRSLRHFNFIGDEIVDFQNVNFFQ